MGLTQEDVASLLSKGGRNRISRIERGKAPPNADEILTYGLLFGSPARDLWPRYHSETLERATRAARKLHKRLEKDPSAVAASKRELLDQFFIRAEKEANARKL